MKKLKRKETIKNKPRSKQQDEGDDDDVNDLLSLLPLDLKTEILSKLPAKSVAKLISISKFWYSTIRSKDFTELFLARSSTRPRLLCIVQRNHREKGKYSYWAQYFHSYSQDDAAFSDHHIIRDTNLLRGFSPPVRGLICCEDSSKVVICNPSTGQLVNLRGLKTRRSGLVSFLGYEPVNDVYKVLCMTVKGVTKNRGSKVVADEHQVFTYGAQSQNSGWRRIECKHPHLPPSRARVLCSNGVLYYYAWINMDGCLIRFDLITEEFDVIILPEEIRLEEYIDLVNYNGKVALMSDVCDGTLDLWVLEDVKKQEWSKVCVLVPSWRDLVGEEGREIIFRGVLSNGELIFAVPCFHSSLNIVCYDPKRNNVRKVVVEGIGTDSECCDVFLDHVQSPMFLPKVKW